MIEEEGIVAEFRREPRQIGAMMNGTIKSSERTTFLEYTNCSLCNNNASELLFQVEERITGARRIFHIVKCEKCGLAYVNPRPTKNDIKSYYPEDSYYAYKPSNHQSVKERMRNVCMEVIGGYPESKNMTTAKKLISYFGKRFVNGVVPYIEGGKVCDIGCGCGNHLLWLKNHKWQTYGVEISQKAAACANNRGLSVFNGELNQAKFPDNYFDVVIMNHVLEHLFDPSETLREIYRVIKTNGLLIIGVPNIESYEARVFGSVWSALQIPQHLYFFSVANLRKLVEKKFRIRSIYTKVFFIGPGLNRESIGFLFRNGSYLKVLYSYIALILKPVLFTLSKRKDTFGQFIFLYAEKL